jgi:hypothetical protein
MAEALNATLDIFVNLKECSGLSRATLVFLATMVSQSLLMSR